MKLNSNYSSYLDSHRPSTQMGSVSTSSHWFEKKKKKKYYESDSSRVKLVQQRKSIESLDIYLTGKQKKFQITNLLNKNFENPS